MKSQLVLAASFAHLAMVIATPHYADLPLKVNILLFYCATINGRYASPNCIERLPERVNQARNISSSLWTKNIFNRKLVSCTRYLGILQLNPSTDILI